MFDIAKIDKNFLVNTRFDTTKLDIYNATEAPFEIYGLIYPKDENDKFKRLPTEVAEKVSEGVLCLHSRTAGGRIRFRTNSNRVALFAKYDLVGRMPHCAMTGSAGFDMYVNNEYRATFTPPLDMEDGYSSLVGTGGREDKEITINFPLYSDVISVALGVEKGAKVWAPEKYRIEKPVVYYGSSITQGACASRPGNSYQEMISRRIGCDYINLGFSGNAKGEDEMAEYISGLEMSAFVYDYDYNAPSPEHLKNTHKRMFDIIRKAHPDLPIIMVSAPAVHLSDDLNRRFQVISQTYSEAVQNSDHNVYLVDGHRMMRDFSGDGGTVDGCHPNDLGFMAMATKIGNILEEIFK